jgi:hypothetical protein
MRKVMSLVMDVVGGGMSTRVRGGRPEPREPTCRIDACDAALPCAFLIHGPGSNGDGGVTATCSSVFFNPIR